jgi:hypothetical protein
MTAHEQAIQTVRVQGSQSYFALNTLTNKELVNAMRHAPMNTPIENEAIQEEILARMAR